MQPLKILVIEGTTRPKRQSINVSKLIAQVGQNNENLNIVHVDPIDFNLPGDGNDPESKDPRFTKLTQEADGFFLVIPEYNHSFPGSLKRLLDSELKNYIHKPVALAGVSAGRLGGVRAIESIVPVLREYGMVATFSDILFPKVQDLFDAQGELLDNAYIDRINSSYEELIWMAKVLQAGREGVPSKHH